MQCDDGSVAVHADAKGRDGKPAENATRAGLIIG